MIGVGLGVNSDEDKAVTVKFGEQGTPNPPTLTVYWQTCATSGTVILANPFAGKVPRAEYIGDPNTPCIPIVPKSPPTLVNLTLPPGLTLATLRTQAGAAGGVG